jgi:MFS family permease
MTKRFADLAGNRWLRIQCVALVMYVISQVDRGNIALAFPGMRHDLSLSASQLGFATGTFFWGYILLQIPVGRLASSWRPKQIILIEGLIWAFICASTALVHTETQLVVNRFLLGLDEGGVLPTMIVLMRAWFTPAERARANLILLGTPIAIAVGNPLSGAAVSEFGWRLMFVVTAIPSLIWCAVWWWAVDDSPRVCTWMPAEEKHALVAALDAEELHQTPSRVHWFKAIWTPSVVLLVAYNFLGLTAFWGLAFWLPTLLVESGRTIGMAGVLSALPYACSIAMAFILSFTSDRWQERKWHVLVPTLFAGLFMALSAAFGTGHMLGLLICLTLTASLWFGRIAIYWVLIADAVPRSSAGAAMAVANGMGNLGGFVGPFVFGWLRTRAGDFETCMVFGGIMFVAAFLVGIMVRADGGDKGGRVTETIPRNSGSLAGGSAA